MHRCLSLIALSLSLWTTSLQGQNQNLVDDAPLFLFSIELDEFIERAHVIYEQGSDQPSHQVEKSIEQLIQIASRIAQLYLNHIETEDHQDIEHYLGNQIEQNPKIRNYFVLLGNQFLFAAQELVAQQESQNRQFRMYGTIGGALLGVAGGSAILYFKPNLVQGFWKSSLLVLGLGAAGAGIGYGGAIAASSFVLPAEPGVVTAQDFLKRFPSGEDFIEEIESLDHDLISGLDAIDEILSEDSEG